MKSTTMRARGLLSVALSALLLALVAMPAGAAPKFKPVPTPIDGLDGVLGLSVGTDGYVYVAEAFGGTLSRYNTKGRRVELARGSVAGVDAAGKSLVWYTSSVPPEAGGDGDAYLMRVSPGGETKKTVNLTAYEAANNPDKDNRYGFMGAGACIGGIADEEVRGLLGSIADYEGIVESNPYAVAVTPSGTLVADAAGNSILRVTPNGQRISTVAVLPPQRAMTVDAALRDVFAGIVSDALGRPVTLPDCLIGTSFVGESVPTDIEVGPDGHYYVSSLPGLPELPGTGAVYRIDAGSGAVTRVATGFSGAVDLAVAPNGMIYVAELFGSQVSVVQGGTTVATIPLPLPGAIEVGADGRVYVAIGTFFGPGAGSVVTFTP